MDFDEHRTDGGHQVLVPMVSNCDLLVIWDMDFYYWDHDLPNIIYHDFFELSINS